MTVLPPSSLIICSRNRPDLLWDTVSSVLAGSHVPEELLIVDQSEKAHPKLPNLESTRGCRIRYIKSQTKGASRARNEGLAAAAHDILVCIDDDMQLPEGCYQMLITTQAQAGPQAVVTGRVLPGQAEKPGGFVPTIIDRNQPDVFIGRIGTDVLPSCLMAMPRAIYNCLGGFDERLGPGGRFENAEDNDYGFRVLEAGFQIIYDPQIIIYHRAWRVDEDYYRLRWTYGRGKGGFYTKYCSLKDPYILLRFIKDVMLRFVRFPWRVLHKPSLAIGDLYYAFGILSASLEWLFAYGLKDRSWK